MPEWNIQPLRRFDKNTNTSEAYYHYYIEAHDETWDLFEMDRKMVYCKVHQVLKSSGEIIRIIKEETYLKCREVKYYYGDPGLSYDGASKALMFMPEFIKKHGLRKSDYVDIELLKIVDDTGKEIESIFPENVIKGNVMTTPTTKPSTTKLPEKLIEQSIQGEFYHELIEEINRSYAYDLFRSTHVLIRTLYENLILKLLKIKFPDQKNIYLSKSGRTLDFSRLIDNLKEMKKDLVPHGGSALNDEFFDFLNGFRENANASTHVLEVYLDSDSIEKDRKKINHYVKLLNSIIDDIGNGM